MQSPQPLFVPLNTHFLFEATGLFALGIIGAAYHGPLFSPYFMLILSLIMFTRLYYNMHSNITALIFASSFIGGYICYEQQLNLYHRLYENQELLSCNIKGIITDISPLEDTRSKQRILLQVSQFQPNNSSKTTTELMGWKPIFFYTYLYVTTSTTYQVSDTIQLNAIAIKKPTNKSFVNYLIKEGISATIFCTHHNHSLLNRPSYSLSRWIASVKQDILQRIHKKMPPRSFALFSSLFLGNRSLNKKIIDNLADQFKQWGISHHLARSGLHLTIFALVWHFIFRLLPFSLFLKRCLLLVLSIIYYLFSWPSISFLRALYSFFLYIACGLLTMRPYFLHSLTLVTLFILLHNPMQLFFLDFQLSFALTFALAWVSHIYKSDGI